MSIFSGLSAFPITPLTPEGEVITDDVARLVGRIEAGGADSVGLLGSTGTYMFLSRAESVGGPSRRRSRPCPRSW